MTNNDSGSDAARSQAKNVLVDFEDGIAWVTLNRPEKRNAINPGIVYEMVDDARRAGGRRPRARWWSSPAPAMPFRPGRI